MKKSLPFILIFVLAYSFIYAQLDWTKYEFNQVMSPGPDNFDVIAIGQPTVLYDEGIIKMWYAGVGNDYKSRLCYATSDDGISWTKHGVVMEVGGDGEWDRAWIDTPEVLKVPDGYYLSYYADTMQQPSEINSSMGAATSPDGVIWTKDPANPVFAKAEIGDWDGTWVESAALYWDGIEEEYIMWYNGIDTATWHLGIGVATSPDGSTWTRYESNPVIMHGVWGAYDDMWCGTPAVIRRNAQFEMWYSATQAEDYSEVLEGFENVSICYATSSDGYLWTKYESNPLFDTYTEPHNPAADLGGPWATDVIFNDDTQTFMMWYEANGGDDNYVLSLATAPIDVSRIGSNLSLDDVAIYPNPVNHFLTIDCESFEGASIFDINGKLVIESSSSRIDVSNLPKSIYLLKVYTENGMLSERIIKI